MEGGDDDIGREGDVAAALAESEIHAARHHAVGLDVEFGQLPVAVQDGTAALATHIEHRESGLAVGIGVAVHAAVAHQSVVRD